MRLLLTKQPLAKRALTKPFNLMLPLCWYASQQQPDGTSASFDREYKPVQPSSSSFPASRLISQSQQDNFALVVTPQHSQRTGNQKPSPQKGYFPKRVIVMGLLTFIAILNFQAADYKPDFSDREPKPDRDITELYVGEGGNKVQQIIAYIVEDMIANKRLTHVAMVSGSSSGSLVAFLLAIGGDQYLHPDEWYEIADQINELFNLNNIRLPSPMLTVHDLQDFGDGMLADKEPGLYEQLVASQEKLIKIMRCALEKIAARIQKDCGFDIREIIDLDHPTCSQLHQLREIGLEKGFIVRDLCINITNADKFENIKGMYRGPLSDCSIFTLLKASTAHPLLPKVKITDNHNYQFKASDGALAEVDGTSSEFPIKNRHYLLNEDSTSIPTAYLKRKLFNALARGDYVKFFQKKTDFLISAPTHITVIPSKPAETFKHLSASELSSIRTQAQEKASAQSKISEPFSEPTKMKRP